MPNAVEFGKLKIDITETPDEVTYLFVGDVDESFRQKEVPRLKKKKITFILEQINNFNSCGIREWIYLVRDIGELGSLHFVACSVTMIDQINMVPDSLGKGIVDSFYAPYYCECGGEVSRLVQVADCLADLQQKHAPLFNCESCGRNLEFDALEDSYFLFAGAELPRAS